jgi:hypothetical protein
MSGTFTIIFYAVSQINATEAMGGHISDKHIALTRVIACVLLLHVRSFKKFLIDGLFYTISVSNFAKEHSMMLDKKRDCN